VADAVDLNPPIDVSEPEADTHGRGLGAVLDALWRWLTDYRLLLAVGAITLLFLLVALALPQMPDQLRNDPGEATRWLLTTAESYGPLGDLLRQLGLFDLLRSPLLKLALGVISLLLLIHLGELIGSALQLRQMPGVLDRGDGVAGEPLPLPPGRRIRRLRTVVSPDQPDESGNDGEQTENGSTEGADSDEGDGETGDGDVIDALAAEMTRDFDDFHRRLAEVAPPPSVAEVIDDPAPVPESRLLGVRGQVAAYLRPLLILGLLAALAAVWLLIDFGWELTSPVLAPGDAYRAASQQVEVRYEVDMVPDEAGALTPTLSVDVGEGPQEVTVDGSTRATVDGVRVDVSSAAPGLLLRTASGQPLLALPGQSTPASAIGLIFPGFGSEEVVLLPRQQTGLRIVRRHLGEEGDAFMVEIYRGAAAEPDQRLAITGGEPQTVAIDEEQSLELLPVSGVSVHLQRTPGAWLIWPALLLSLAGIYGFWKRPGFLLVQIAPWFEDKQVIVAQSDLASEIEKIEKKDSI
jgi:hypothetical protein